MVIRLYIEKVGPEESSGLEVRVNTEAKVIEINGDKIFSGSPSYISGPEYRDGKYPTICMRYEIGFEGIKNREETITAIKNIRCIKVRQDECSLYSIKEVIREETEDPKELGYPKEFIESKNEETFPFLDLIFPIMTRITVSNWSLK